MLRLADLVVGMRYAQASDNEVVKEYLSILRREAQ